MEVCVLCKLLSSSFDYCSFCRTFFLNIHQECIMMHVPSSFLHVCLLLVLGYSMDRAAAIITLEKTRFSVSSQMLFVIDGSVRYRYTIVSRLGHLPPFPNYKSKKKFTGDTRFDFDCELTPHFGFQISSKWADLQLCKYSGLLFLFDTLAWMNKIC